MDPSVVAAVGAAGKLMGAVNEAAGGGPGTSWRASRQRRRVALAERDEMITALGVACMRLMVEADLVRSLSTRSSKVRQLAFGMMEVGQPGLGGSAWADAFLALAQGLGAAGGSGLRHLSPVAGAEAVRQTFLPLLSEIFALTVRLSMSGDEGIKKAVIRIGDAAGGVLAHVDEPRGRYATREKELQDALGQLRRARDAARTHWRRRRKALGG